MRVSSRSIVWSAVALGAVVGIGCDRNTTGPGSADHRLILTPADTTIEFFGKVTYRVADAADGSAVGVAGQQFSSSDPSIVSTACSPPTTACGQSAGSVTIHAKTTDGREGSATIRVLPARMIISPDTPFVVGHTQAVGLEWTRTDVGFINARVSDTTVARITNRTGGASAHDTVQIQFLRAGTFTLTAFVELDTTLRGSAVFSVQGSAAASFRPITTTTLTRGKVPFALPVAVLDQRGSLLAGASVHAVIGGGDGVAQVTSVDALSPSVTTVHIQPVTAGLTTLHLTSGNATLDVPLVITAVATDTAVVLPARTIIDVSANDLTPTGPVRIVVPPQHGTASVVANGIQFDPAPNYRGPDSLRYVSTSGSRTDTALVTLALMPGPYTATVVGVVAGTPALNDAGQVAGSLLLADGTTRAFRWTNGRVDTLQYNALATQGVGIDSVGDVIGTATESFTTGRALLWRPAVAGPLDLLAHAAQVCCVGISRSGVAYVGADGAGILWRNGIVTAARFPGFFVDVNDNGDAVFDVTAGFRPSSEIVFADGTTTFFSLGGRGISSVAKLNDLGMAVGQSEAVANDFLVSHPFLSHPGGIVDLTSIYGSSIAEASRINDNGWIAGAQVFNESPVATASLFINGASARLSALLADPALRSSFSANNFPLVGLNNNGQILALVTGSDGVSRAVLLTPATR
jgi:hypothetical protein